MCAGAIVLSRIPRVVYATRRPEGRRGRQRPATCWPTPRLNHRPEVVAGVLADEAADAPAVLLSRPALGSTLRFALEGCRSG